MDRPSIGSHARLGLMLYVMTFDFVPRNRAIESLETNSGPKGTVNRLTTISSVRRFMNIVAPTGLSVPGVALLLPFGPVTG
jgi:hypothetical protein